MRRGAERRRAALQQHHRQDASAARDRGTSRRRRRGRPADAARWRRSCESPPRIEGAAEQRIVRVVERQPGRELARRRVPRLRHRDEPATRRRRLVSLERKAVGTRRARRQERRDRDGDGERAAHQPGEQRGPPVEPVEAEVAGVMHGAQLPQCWLVPDHAHAGCSRARTARRHAAHAAVVRIVLRVDAALAALLQVGAAGHLAARRRADGAGHARRAAAAAVVAVDVLVDADVAAVAEARRTAAASVDARERAGTGHAAAAAVRRIAVTKMHWPLHSAESRRTGDAGAVGATDEQKSAATRARTEARPGMGMILPVSPIVR